MCIFSRRPSVVMRERVEHLWGLTETEAPHSRLSRFKGVVEREDLFREVDTLRNLGIRDLVVPA